MTKEEIIPNAVQFFEKNPECQEMLATTDGNFFNTDSKRSHYAASHASTLPDKEVYRITRADAMGAGGGLADMTSKELKVLCAEYPNEEWKSLKKDALIEYIEGKQETTDDSEEPTNDSEETEDDTGISPDEVTEEDAAAYKEATSKPAVWQNKVTSGFIAWKEGNQD